MSSNSNHLGTALSRPSTPTGIRRSIPEHAESVREALAKEKANNASLGTHSIASPVLSSVQWDGIVHHANATNDACDRLVKAIKTHRPQRGPVQAESSEQFHNRCSTYAESIHQLLWELSTHGNDVHAALRMQREWDIHTAEAWAWLWFGQKLAGQPPYWLLDTLSRKGMDWKAGQRAQASSGYAVGLFGLLAAKQQAEAEWLNNLTWNTNENVIMFLDRELRKEPLAIQNAFMSAWKHRLFKETREAAIWAIVRLDEMLPLNYSKKDGRTVALFLEKMAKAYETGAKEPILAGAKIHLQEVRDLIHFASNILMVSEAGTPARIRQELRQLASRMRNCTP